MGLFEAVKPTLPSSILPPAQPPAALLLLSALLVAFLLLPVLALLWRGLSPQTWALLFSPATLTTLLATLQVSLLTTGCTLLLTVALATPIAWLLARFDFRGKALLDTLLDLPIVLPPVVAGLGLLLTFGRGGLLGEALQLAGISLAFSPAAVVTAQLFVAAPYYLRAAKAGFMAVDRQAEEAALTDGAGRWQAFWLVTWPLAFPFLLEGLVLTWARALGEFGATILFAGSLPGKTRTITLAIYAALESDLAPALVMATFMVVVAFAALLVVRVLARAQQA